MKTKGLQNWMGILSLVLLIAAVIMLFFNWVIFKDGPKEVAELRAEFFDDPMCYPPVDGRYLFLHTVTKDGFSPFGLAVYMAVAVGLLRDIYLLIFAWTIILLFAVLVALVSKLIIQRIMGKKAKGILAGIIYGMFAAILIYYGSFYDIIMPWPFVGLAAMIGSIIFWTIHCRESDILVKE